MTLSRAWKAVAAVVGAVIVFVQSGITADGLTNQEWLQVVIAGVGAFSVWLTANYIQGNVFDRYAKFITAAVFAGLTALSGFILDEHLSSSEIWNAIIAGVAAVGVLLVENDRSTLVTQPAPPPH